MTWVKIFWCRISGLKHTSWDFELDMSIKKSSFFLERITLLWLCLPITCLEPHRGHTNVHLFGYDKGIRNHFRPSSTTQHILTLENPFEPFDLFCWITRHIRTYPVVCLKPLFWSFQELLEHQGKWVYFQKNKFSRWGINLCDLCV